MTQQITPSRRTVFPARRDIDNTSTKIVQFRHNTKVERGYQLHKLGPNEYALVSIRQARHIHYDRKPWFYYLCYLLNGKIEKIPQYKDNFQPPEKGEEDMHVIPDAVYCTKRDNKLVVVHRDDGVHHPIETWLQNQSRAAQYL